MKKVTKIAWKIKTGNQWWSGTDSQVNMEIYRDNSLLQRLRLEPGQTTRLNRNEDATYYWVFQNPDGVGVAVSGVTVPYHVDFPNGTSGHLKVKFIARGDDAWEKTSIVSTVYSGDLKWVPGTIDGVFWEEHQDVLVFNRDVVLSTDSSEGFTSLTLLY